MSTLMMAWFHISPGVGPNEEGGLRLEPKTEAEANEQWSFQADGHAVP